MPVFECSRCNNLTYSASRFTTLTCAVCGGARHRVLDHAFSFDDARSQPRDIVHGDHCCLSYDDAESVAPLVAAILRRGLADGARVIAYPPRALRARVEATLTPEESARIDWHLPEAVYGDDFDADRVIEEFRAIADATDGPVYVIGGADRPHTDVCSLETFRDFERRATALGSEVGMVIGCLYDRTIQPDEVIGASAETHPLAASHGALRRNVDFVFAA